MDPLVLTVPERFHARGVRNLAAGLERARDASVVVLVGSPGRFCLGMDFHEVTTGDLRGKLERFAALIGALALCPRPTLAVIDGPALGGGLGLAAACDLVIASERARFGLPEALYGLAPAMIRPALETRLSPAQLRMLLFTGYTRDAREAERLGLVDQVVAIDALEAAQRTAMRQLARARSATVEIVRGWQGDLAAALARGVSETATALADPAVRVALSEEVPWQR